MDAKTKVSNLTGGGIRLVAKKTNIAKAMFPLVIIVH
jgi:hypothetical protein